MSNNKRKPTEELYGENVKYFRESYSLKDHVQQDDGFEVTHLVYTNKELAKFVRDSIKIIRAQSEEINNLRSIINNK